LPIKPKKQGGTRARGFTKEALVRGVSPLDDAVYVATYMQVLPNSVEP
jgi:hypothetical protein